MIISLLLSFITISVSTVLSVITGGGTLAAVLDFISFIGVSVLFTVAMFVSGYGKIFCRIFSSKKKFQALDLQELKKTDLALDFASKILFYTALLIPVLVVIYTLRNYYKDAETYSHLGPNGAVFFLSILYLALFEMIIYTLKAKVRKSVILYMAEDSGKTVEKIKVNSKSIVKMILGIGLFLAVCLLYGYISGIYAWGRYSLISTIFDIPFLVIMFIYVWPLIAISGNLSTLFGGIKTALIGHKIDVTKKSLYLNAVKTAMYLNWYGAFSGACCGWIGILCNLEDASVFPANLAVSLIPFFYATCINLSLLLVEIRVIKASE